MRTISRLLLAGSILLTGCAHAALQYGRDGLAPVDRVLRANLAAGQYGSAYETSLGTEVRTRDRLLRALSVGTLGFYANRTDSSVWALDRAWSLTEDRWTKRVSAAAASVVVNDYVLPYTPGRTERLFIPYYGALSWLARGDGDDAAVEARRLVQALGIAGDGGDDAADGNVRGVLHYVAGAVFEATGNRDAADVAYRNAQRLVQVAVARDTTVADSLLGDVVVVVERGFVGHPVPRDETVWVSRGEAGVLRAHDGDNSDRTARGIGMREGTRGLAPGYARGLGMEVGLSLNWAEFRDGRDPVRSFALVTPEASQEVAGGGNVTQAVRADFQRGQPARFARALLRAATRATLHKAAGDQLAKVGTDGRDPDGDARRGHNGRGGTADRVDLTPARTTTSDATGGDATDDKMRTAGAVGRALLGLSMFALAAASDVYDVPDLRSWNLLPHDVRVVRLRLPAGVQDVHAVIDGQSVIIGRADVRRGQVRVLTYRAFSNVSQ